MNSRGKEIKNINKKRNVGEKEEREKRFPKKRNCKKICALVGINVQTFTMHIKISRNVVKA